MNHQSLAHANLAKRNVVVRYLIAAALGAVTTLAFGARPFVTDDARTVDAGGCQIESFAKQQGRAREAEFWFLPACNPLGNLEMTLGTMHSSDAPGSFGTTIVQGKTLLRALRTNDFGLGLTLGTQRTSPTVPMARWNPYINMIASVSTLNDKVVFHANAGAINERAASRTRGTWGLGAEIALDSRLFAIAESYGQEADRPSKQIGLRYWVEPNRLQVDTTLGGQRGKTWVSMGIRALF
ncbi:MAG: hypothetical protein ACKVQK_16485 [Burkholderiales bacterium]